MTITETAPSAPPDKTPRGGRPRDPDKSGHILDVVVTLLAENGPHGFTMDDLAAEARVGKATIYRRWKAQNQLLYDAVRELGVRDIDWGTDEGALRDDLVTLLRTATVGDRAYAELSLLCTLPFDEQLRNAYEEGPVVRLSYALQALAERAEARGEKVPDVTRIHAALSLIRHNILVHGHRPTGVTVGRIVDTVVLYGQRDEASATAEPAHLRRDDDYGPSAGNL